MTASATKSTPDPVPASDCLTLGIETSGRFGSVALACEGRCLQERRLSQSGRRHAQTLVSEAARLLEHFGLTAKRCGEVSVSIGPGSFTGLRVGAVFAKTFAYATGCRLAAVDTMLCVAEACPKDVDDVYVIADAQRGELYVGRYQRQPNGDWIPSEPIQIVNAGRWSSERAPDDNVSGPALDRYEELLTPRARLLAPAYRHPCAAIVARLGHRKIQSGRSDDCWSLEPFYLRKSAAEENANSRNR